MEFFTTLSSIITQSDRSKKIALFEKLFEAFTHEDVTYDHEEPVIRFTKPSYSTVCQVISPQKLPKRKRLDTAQGQIIFIHAVAHIEYSAIDLALDAAYRFRNMPRSYYQDWLEVASDEIRHFLMLVELLESLGSYYGAIPVHDSLFEAGVLTQTLLDRMAVIPRYMEANGLDANPKFIEKLKKLDSTPMIARLTEVLEVILEEEVDHVLKGDRWFEYACEQEGKEKSIYFEIIKKYYPKTFPRTHSVNIEARKRAGFSCDELYTIAKVEC